MLGSGGTPALARGIVALLVPSAVLLLGVQAATASPVQTGDSDCPPGPGYPVDIEIEAQIRLRAGHFEAGGGGRLEFDGAVPGEEYCGTVSSLVFSLGEATASPDGSLAFAFAVPASFELATVHHADLFRDQRLVAAFDFCVDGAGDVRLDATGCEQAGDAGAGERARGGALSATGARLLPELVRAGAVLVALGTLVLLAVRHRRARLA